MAQDQERLRGVALVTGGGGGLGRAVAAQLRSAGMTVVTADLPGRGGDIECDVTDAGAVQSVVDGIVRTHGALDVVIANAGIGSAGVVESLSADAWSRTIDVNVRGAVNTLRAVYPTMIERRRGHIVFVASLAGLGGTPLLVPYAMSKAAVVGLAHSLRPEAARHGIGVSVVCPGPIDTDFLDTGGVSGVVEGVNVRRYLIDAAGKPISADAVATAILRGIRRNQATVVPGRAGVLWRVARFVPGLVERVSAKTMAKELEAAARART